VGLICFALIAAATDRALEKSMPHRNRRCPRGLS